MGKAKQARAPQQAVGEHHHSPVLPPQGEGNQDSSGEIQFHLEDFNGPLDLLLALVGKNKMSIYEIEILVLIDQYLLVVNQRAQNVDFAENPALETSKMESASEFITMAARLVQIKSTLLLPRSDEGERMREELTGLLVEYSACKEVAGKLREMAQGVFIAVRVPTTMVFSSEYRGSHTCGELSGAYMAMVGRGKMRRAPQRERFDEIVTAPFVSVTGRVIGVLRGLMTGRISRLCELFFGSSSRSETVATFLALLELIRGGRVSIEEDEALRVRSARDARAERVQERAEWEPKRKTDFNKAKPENE